MGPSSRALCRGPAVAIVVRSVLGRMACRGHQPHHDHQEGGGGGTAWRRIPPSPPTCAIEARLAACERRRNATATTFNWRFTAGVAVTVTVALVLVGLVLMTVL